MKFEMVGQVYIKEEQFNSTLGWYMGKGKGKGKGLNQMR